MVKRDLFGLKLSHVTRHSFIFLSSIRSDLSNIMIAQPLAAYVRPPSFFFLVKNDFAWSSLRKEEEKS